jgi:hypothetical protein
MITWSTRGRENKPCLASQATPAKPRHHGGGDAALHVAGAAAVDAPVLHRAGERLEAPPHARLDHVDVAVEMHAWPGPAALVAGDDVGPGEPVAVADRTLGPHERDLEPGALQPVAEMARAGFVGVARRVDGRDPDQLTGELDQRVALAVDPLEQRIQHRSSPGRPRC